MDWPAAAEQSEVPAWLGLMVVGAMAAVMEASDVAAAV